MATGSDVSDATRKIMCANKGKDTRPEMIVRRIVHGMGYRYRLHERSLPGKPDLVFGARKKVIFVHGCFWHWHECQRCTAPKMRSDYWRLKFERNRTRDAATVETLRANQWSILTVWECETRKRDRDELARRISEFLS